MGNQEDEKRWNKCIKKSVKGDRAKWFEQILAEGNWNAIQKFRKFKKCTYTKLRDSDGVVLNSD